MNNNHKPHPWSLLLLVPLLLVLPACQTAAPEASQAMLQEARQAVAKARQQPRPAQLELARAEETLAQAEQAWQKTRDGEEVRHLAYLARQRAQLAINLSEQRAAEAQLADSAGERERILADARARQAQAGQIQAQQQAEALKQELQSLRAQQTSKGLVVTLQDVLFDSGKAELKPQARRVVERLAEVMTKHPERRLRLEGYTDSVGSETFNLNLSQQRADAVRRALLAQGVPNQRLEVAAEGEAYPVASNDTPEGRQQNRRVEVVVSDERGQFAAP